MMRTYWHLMWKLKGAEPMSMACSGLDVVTDKIRWIYDVAETKVEWVKLTTNECSDNKGGT